MTNQMKLSDYVAHFLAKQGLKHVFIITGGASLHLFQSLSDNLDVMPVCTHHEQAAAMSADAYARVTGNIGCAIGTSGPGATNLITGIAGAWFDSVPTIFITGQVATYRMKGDTPIRQMGFQETEILPMVAPITKYAVLVDDPQRIAYELEKAVHIARSGRPGPVLIDIPDDLQRKFVIPDTLQHFTPKIRFGLSTIEPPSLDLILSLLRQAERPVVVIGWGIHLAGARSRVAAFVQALKVPVLTSWGGKDLVADDEPLLVGTFGTHGTRAGNFTIQNADLVIAVGARLSTHETGTPITDWAREAKIVVVDIDRGELDKFEAFGKRLDLPIQADAGVFIDAITDLLRNCSLPEYKIWHSRIAAWRQAYPVQPTGDSLPSTVNPYVFVKALSDALAKDEHIFVDTGCAVAWTMQGFPVRQNQRLYHDFNNTAMGWALPAAIGGCFARQGRPVTCIVGDGSLMMNIQELATVQRHTLPICIILLNNSGYSMVRQTQEQWLDSRYIGTSYEGGLAFPDFELLAKSFQLNYVLVEDREQVYGVFNDLRNDRHKPVLINVIIPAAERVLPQAKFGYPIEDAEPLLPREELISNMIVKLLPVSLDNR